MPPLQSHPTDFQTKLHFLQHCADELSLMLASTRLDALEYANILQVILNTHDEIRSTTVAWRYQATSNDKRGV